MFYFIEAREKENVGEKVNFHSQLVPTKKSTPCWKKFD